MKVIKRNELGLLEGVKYKFTPNENIDWRAMIDSKHLYVNSESFQRRGEPIPTSTENVADKDLVSTLAGLKELAALRGYTSVTYRPIIATDTYAATVCQICWIGNYETEMYPVAFEAMACAHIGNTNNLTQNYLIETAENRSLARCIRNFLRIHIVAKEELSGKKDQSNNRNGSNSVKDPRLVLADYLTNKGKTLEDVKEKLVGEGITDAESYNAWEDIPKDVAFEMLERFKNLKKSPTKTVKRN